MHGQVSSLGTTPSPHGSCRTSIIKANCCTPEYSSAFAGTPNLLHHTLIYAEVQQELPLFFQPQDARCHHHSTRWGQEAERGPSCSGGTQALSSEMAAEAPAMISSTSWRATAVPLHSLLGNSSVFQLNPHFKTVAFPFLCYFYEVTNRSWVYFIFHICLY